MIKNVVEKNKNIDVNADKMDKLKEMFPNCFNANGDFDISVFEEELKTNSSIVKEGYGLNFLGKNYAKYVASLDTETILVPDEENNNKDENNNSENIYISGDNIDALKHLVKSYSGQIKCIYIDPPYNTGSDGFVYNDKFNLSIDKLVEVLDINEEEAKRIYNMTNAKSNSHSAWLTFMYPRLYIAKQLLNENGVILISIDDNEQSQLKLLCDNIFGEENFLAQFIWKGGRRNASKYISTSHEYMLLYAKSINSLEKNKIDFNEPKKGLNKIFDVAAKFVKESNYDYTKASILLKKWYNSLSENDDCKLNKHYNNIDENGVYFASDISRGGGGGPKWEIINPNTGNVVITPSRGWAYSSKEELLDDISNGLIHFNGDGVPCKKRYLSDLNTQLMETVFYKDRRSSSKKLIELMDGNVFDFPKDVDIISDKLKSICKEKDCLIMDFFSGSATTAHAVMKLNAEDNGNRKYIMVQLPELCDTKSEAYKNGYKTIDEIGQERIRRAAKKIKEETNADIDYGFKHYTIKDVNTNTLDKLEKFEPNYVISDGSILDEFGINAVLTTWMNEDGYGLTDTYEKLELEDYTAYKCQNTIYLLNWNISDLFIKALIEKYEKEENFDCNRIVMFGYSFTLNDIQTLKDNLQQVKNIKGINVEVITRY